MKNSKTAEITAIEKALLGGMLFDPTIIPEALAKLEPADFYLPPQQRIYSAIIESHAAGEPVDFLSIHERVGGSFGVFTDLYDTALPGHVVYFTNKILDASARRRAQAMMAEAMADLGQGGDVEAQYSRISEGFVEMLKGRSRIQKVSSVMTALIQELDDSTLPKIIFTGFGQLDGFVGGFRGGTSWIIAGRTSMGKSSFAMQLAKNAVEKKHGVLYCAIEDGNRGFATRLLANESGVDSRRITAKTLKEFDYARIATGHGEISASPLYLLDGENRWARIRAEIQLAKMADANLSVVFLDYLGLIRASGFRDRYGEMTFLSQELKRLALELDIAVVAICQINRQTEGRKDHRPTLGDLRDSGAIEQDADIILLLYRPYYYDKLKNSKTIEIVVAKNRNGPIGVVELSFDAPTFKFSEEV